MKMITIYYFDLIVSQLTNCSNYVKLFWYDEELFVRSFLCSVPWFVIAETFYHIKDMKFSPLKVFFKSKEVNVESSNFGNQQVLFSSAAFNSVVIYTSTKRWELINFGAFSILSWLVIRYFELVITNFIVQKNNIKVNVYQFLKDICEEDEPSVIGERVASVYWEGFLKYVNHHLGKFELKGTINDFQSILTSKKASSIGVFITLQKV